MAAITTPLVSYDEPATSIWPSSPAMWATCVYMALYVVRPWETLIPELASLRFERVAYVVIMLTVAGSSGLRWRWDGPINGLMAFVAALCISAVAAYDPTRAWSAPDGLYVYLTKLLGAVLIISVVRSRYDLMYMVAVAVGVIFAFAGKSLWEYSIHGAGRTSMGVLRLTGINDTFGHPNAVAALLAGTLPWCVFLWRVQGQFTAQWPVKWASYFKSFLAIAFCTFVACVLLTGSRAGFVGLIAFGVFSWFRASGNRLKMALVIGVAVIIGMVWLDEEHTQRIRSLWDDSANVAGGLESKEGRRYAFEAGLRMFQQYPVTGVGIGNFAAYRARNDDGVYLDAHSIPAQLLGETGILGTVAFLYFLWTLYRATRRLKINPVGSDDETDRMLSELGTAMRNSLILLLIVGMANHLSYLFIWIWMAAFLSCAIVVGRRSMPFESTGSADGLLT